MILSYCDISATPAFQNLVTDVTPELGDKANREVFRDYLEYNGQLRSPEDIINKLASSYFSTIVARPNQAINKEIVMTQAAKFKDLGRSVPKKQLSNTEIIKLKETISKANNELVKKNINRVYRLEDITQVGQSDNYTWNLKVYPGKLNVENKQERLSTEDLLNNRIPRLITQGTKQLELDIQTNIRTALLGINSTTDGSTNSGTGNSKQNSRVLTESNLREISKNNFILEEESELDSERHIQVSRRTSSEFAGFKNLERFSGKSFKDIFSSNDYGSEDIKIYIASRFAEALNTNILLRGICDGLVRISGGTVHPRRIKLANEGLTETIYVRGERININLSKNGKLDETFRHLYNTGTDLDKYIDIAAFEELIHLLSNTIIPNDLNIEAFKLFIKDKGLQSVVSNFYSEGRVKDEFGLYQEYIRSLAQVLIGGETTETIRDVNNPAKFNVLLKLWRFLADTFNKVPQYENVARKIEKFIQTGEGTYYSSESNDLTSLDTVVNYSQQIIRQMADAMNQQIGVNYSFISPIEASEITKNSQNPWRGQKSFFFNGQVYFIEGELTPSDVLHEFVHPIIKNISGTNKPLFNNLYNKIETTDEGKKIIESVSELYPDLDKNSDDFKEEVLVRGIEQKRDLDSKGLEVTSKFKKFVDDLLYSIKQLLRNLFGQKIQVQTLSPNTTLQKLSDILEAGGKFELDPEIISNEDLVAYKNEYNKIMQDFVAERADKTEIEKLTNTYFETVKKFLVNLRKQENLGELSNILENKYGTGELQKMQKNLKSYQSLILQDSKELEDTVELTRQRTTAVINSLGNADNMISYINDGLKELVKDINNPENVRQVLYYQKFINYWGDFVANAVITLETNGVKEVPFINNVVGNVDRANRLINDFYLKSSKEFLSNTLKGFMEEIDNKGKSRIKELQDKNAPQTLIDKAKSDYETSKLTPKMIEDALKGNLKDVSWAGAYMEEFGNSPDPVVGGLALFIQNRMTKMEVTVQQRFSNIASELKPLLEENNYNQFNSKDLGPKLGQKELVGKVNSETGEFEENEIWRFQNQFTGADIIRDRFLFNVKQAGLKYSETNLDEDKQKLADIQTEWANHKRNFWNDKYTEPFYKAYDLLKVDSIGNEARLTIDNLYDELNELSSELERASSLDVLDITDEIESKRREIRQVSSLTDISGNLKKAKELEIAERLQKFNEAIKDIYRSEEIPQAFQTAYQAYEQKLKDEGKKSDSFEFKDLLEKWKSKNIRSGITEEFWTKMDLLNTAVKNILSTIPQQDRINLEIEDNYKIIKDLVKGNRDESGQPLGSELSPEKQEKIKTAQENIDRARAELDKISGLNKSEQNEINLIMAKLTDQEKLSKQETVRLSQLLDKQGRLKLNKVQRAELRSLFNELDELRSKEPTDSYIDTINDFVSSMNSEAVYDILKTLNISKDNINRFVNTDLVDKLFVLSPEFEEWFKRNHILKDAVNMETNEDIQRWERTYAWNVIIPRDEKYYEKTEIKNLAGQSVILKGLPSLKYYKRLVNQEFLTPEIIGQTKDNKGYWLPKTIEQGASDDRYQNKEYLRLKQADPKLYSLLEKMKEIHLKNQEGADGRAKLWLDMPRYRKQIVERLQGKNPVEKVVSQAKNFWTSIKDKWENGFNYDDNLNLIKLDLLDTESSGIPVSGLSNLNIEDVSTDIIYSTLRYMLGIEKNKALTETAPMAKAIQAVVNDKANIPSEERLSGNSVINFVNGKKSRYVRQKAINNYIEKTYQGVQNVGFGADSAIAQNLSNFLFKRASTAFLAFNIPSGIKNALGQKFQGLVEATAGRYMSTQSFLQAEKWATATTFKYTTEIYKNGPKSLDIQISELFDPERGKFQNTFGQSFTRTPGKDTIKVMERMNDFRQWVQLQASLQTLGGMMIHEKIPTKSGGNINYMDAWELKDNKIHIKDSVDPSYGVSYDQEGNLVLGDKFIALRNKYQRVIDNLNGSMGREQRPEADRYLLFKYVSFFRRFLTSMLTNRFAYSGSILSGTARGRYDYRLGQDKLGWYIQFGKLVANSFRTGFKNLPYMSSDEKAAFFRMMTEVGTVSIMNFLIVPLIFGFDDGDDDRYKKLKAKSGPLPLYGVMNDPAHPFDLGGWLSNHALLQFEQVSNENDQFIVWPGMGLNNFKEMLDIKTLVAGPTLKSYIDIINDAYLVSTGNEKAYYQRNSNAYFWAQEGELKLWNHIGKAIGFNASTVDPVNSLKNFESMQNR